MLIFPCINHDEKYMHKYTDVGMFKSKGAWWHKHDYDAWENAISLFKHPGCYNPPPLKKESRPEIRVNKLRVEGACTLEGS